MSFGKEIQRASLERLEAAVELRRDLHRRPELGNDLPETRERVLAALAGLGLEIKLSEHPA